MIEIIPNWHLIFVHFTVALFSASVSLYVLVYFIKHLKPAMNPLISIKQFFIAALLVCFSSSLYAQYEHHMSMQREATSAVIKQLLPKQNEQQGKKTQPVKTRVIPLTHGENRVVNLVVSYKMVNFGGRCRKAIAVNDQIPAPTLHFKEGDHVIINVYNHLDKGTSIHWHGILVPWQMDGVEHVSQQAIPPGCVFHYQFTLMQAGTYWYHAHAGIQEQEGLYGAFVIDPPVSPFYQYNKDYVIVLSDWSNAPGEKVFANLKKDGDYYSPRFPLQPSLMKFIHDYRKGDCEERKKLIADYKIMQQMRMSIYDLSDVAYDAYLLNGQTKCNPWVAPVQVRDTVRLRFIGAAGSTIYHVKIPGTKMQMVHVQGNDVKPYMIDDFWIAPGETYDVLVKIENTCPYIIYAESIDTLGKAYGALVTDPRQNITFQVQSFPEPNPVTREMMDNMMMGMDHGSMYMDMKNPSMMKMNSKSSGKMQMSANSKMPMPNMQSDMKSIHNSDTHSMPPSTSMKDMNMSGMNQKKMNRSMKNMVHGKSTKTPLQMTMGDHKKMDGHEMKMDHSMDMDMDMDMNMEMNMPTEPSIVGDRICPPRACFMINENNMGHSMGNDKPKKCLDVMTSGTKYQDLTAAVKTNDPNIPVTGVIRMELFGYMDRFIWFVNGLPEYKAHPILIEPNQRYRIIFTNNSMMRHPMHIHGHWFILRNGHGAYDPLLHTIEVPPGATAVADVDTDASGQWFFHCHHLYHMMAGMARVFQYGTLVDIAKGCASPQDYAVNTAYINRPIVRVDEQIPLDTSLVEHPMGHHAGLYLASFLDVGEDPFHNVQEMTFKGLYGPDYNKLELYTDDAEINQGKVENADIDIFYWHQISQFWAIKGGANYFYRPAETPYWQPGIGIEGLMPYFIDTNARAYYHAGSTKLDVELSRDTQITNNFFVRGGIRSIVASKTVEQAEIGSGLNQMRYTFRPYYRVMPGFSIFAEYEHDQNYGAFKRMEQNSGESASENTMTFGFTVLF